MKNRTKWCFLLFAVLFNTVFSGIRGPGVYSGVVVFDRWGGCTLYSGVYVMYISDEVKDKLRSYANKCVKINATEVFQPMNPGDGLIKAFDSIEYQSGSGDQPYGVTVGGIELKNLIACKMGQIPAVMMQIINRGSSSVEIYSEELAPTLLIKQTDDTLGSFTPADGPSMALITRQAFWVGGYPGGESRWQGGGARFAIEYKWTIGEENALPRTFHLQPGEKKRVKITFDLPPGQYEFLSGYGGGVHAGKCIAGNRIPFDVDKNRRAKRPSVGPVEPWLVNNDLPEEVVEIRDKMLSRADQKIRNGLLQLADIYPRLKKGVDYQTTVSGQSGTGRISIYLGHRELRMDEDPFPEEERFQVSISLGGPPSHVVQIALAPLYPNLGLVGNKQVMAGVPELEAELRKLVDDALKPLKEFNDSLNTE